MRKMSTAEKVRWIDALVEAGLDLALADDWKGVDFAVMWIRSIEAHLPAAVRAARLRNQKRKDK